MFIKPSATFTPVWRLFDARGKVLGRLASEIATILMGKHKPIYHPAADLGDYVVVINAKEVRVTGRKAEQKVYRHHTQFVGGLKEIPFERMMERAPERVLLSAVNGMLPKNNLRRARLRKLRVFPGAEHPFAANVAFVHPDAGTKGIRTTMLTAVAASGASAAPATSSPAKRA